MKETGWGTFKLEQIHSVNQTFEVAPMKNSRTRCESNLFIADE